MTVAQSKSWAAFLLLVLVVLIPSVCVWWLVDEASKSKRLAMKQLFNDARNSYLDTGKSTILEEITSIRTMFDALLEKIPVEQWEATVFQKGSVDGFFVAAATLSQLDEERGEDDEIQKWALKQMNVIKLALKESRELDALSEITKSLSDERILRAKLEDGRWLAPMWMYLTIDLSKEKGAEEKAWLDLKKLMLSDENWQMPLSQRNFYLKKLYENFEDTETKRFYQRVKTVSEWIDLKDGHLQPSTLPELGQLGDFVHICLSKGEAVLIYRKENFQAQMNALLNALPSRVGGRLSIRQSSEDLDKNVTTVALPLHSDLENWALVFSRDSESGSVEEADREVLFLVFVGTAVVALSLFLSFSLYRVMRRQADLAQLKNDLVATVSHELKTPVASIRLLIDVLQKNDSWDTDRVREYIELISKENKRLGRLIENFLSFSRMERNKGSFVLQEASAQEIVLETESVFRESIANGTCRLRVSIEDGLKPILADNEALQTALDNLLENAWKYGGENPEIELSVVAAENGVIFSVSDQGEGIPKDEQEKVFERFYQSKQRLSEHTGGVGLGLSIVSFIVEKHGGQVSLESSLGKGSVFKIRIPYA